MNTATPVSMRLRAWIAALVSLLMVAGGLTLGATPARAATGDVTGATLSWGVKESFRNYISGPIAHGGWTTTAPVTGAFAWTSGTGTADQAAGTGMVSYGGSIHFTGHEGFGGIGAGNYALDLTISNVRVQQASAMTATIIVDTYSNSIAAPTTFVTSSNVEFASVDLTSAGASTSTTVAVTNAPAVLTPAGAAAFAGFYGAGTALDPVSFTWPVEQAPVTPEPVTPTITVSATTDISPAGQKVIVTGTGFLADGTATNGSRAPLANRFSGAYVAFGRFADVWQPSAGAGSGTRVTSPTATYWAVNAADVATVGGAARGAIAIDANGSFTVEMTIGRGFTGEPSTGNYGIYTYSGSGGNYAGFETFTPITFSTAPVVSVSATTGLNPLGETITVRGWNFTPNAPASNALRPPLSGRFGGSYVAFGKFADVWKASEGAASSARATSPSATLWGVDAADVATIGGAARGGMAIAADGTFTAQLTVARGFTGEPSTGNYGIYTYPGGGSTYAAFETYTPISFTAATTTAVAVTATAATEGGPTTLTATVTPAAAGTVTFREGTTVLGTAPATAATLTVSGVSAGSHTYTAEFVPSAPLVFSGSTGSTTLTVAPRPVEVAAGSLTWGFKESFRSYISGPIARGSISTNGVATAGGAFVFGQAPGGTFTSAGGTGSAAYGGSVRFSGHDGVLDITFSELTVSVESASRGTLSARVNGGPLTAIATLDLAAGIRSTPGNTVAFSGVPATLTAAGASVFSYRGSTFYPAGTALDPVNVVIGTPASAVAGGVRTIAVFQGERQPAATPPATQGITVSPSSLQNLVAGGEITITMDGFAPNETGIMIVIYSDPVVLARDLTADAAGRVTWTGRLPATLTGSHTLTAQGSVNRGVVLDIPATAPAADACPVTDATLSWGFKESFRSYISGSIANGEWTVADGATYETPSFGWSGGSGSYDAGTGLVAFTGSITFTGHGGVLNTTVANPQLVLRDGDTAVLLLDVSGTTQDGATVDSTGVEFVELDLSAATVDESDGAISVSDAPATLTAAGSAAFGTYEAGEAFDPVSFTFATDADCATVAPVETTAIDDDVDAAPASSDGPNLWWIWLVAALLVAAVATVVVVLRRRSRTA